MPPQALLSHCNSYISSGWMLPNSSLSDFTSNWTLGSWANISWLGDAPYLANQQENWRLILGWFSDNSLGSAFSDGHNYELTSVGRFSSFSPDCFCNCKLLKLICIILEGWLFTYGFKGNPSWVLPDLNPTWVMLDGNRCDYSVLQMWWEIKTNIDISSNQKFKIFALNQTNTNEIITKTSPGFLLLPSTVSSTSSSVSTAASHSSSDTSQISFTPSDTLITVTSAAAITRLATPGPKPNDLSSGAKAGIGVSCAVLACSILLGTVFFFMGRRRQPTAYNIGPFSFRHPELDGRAAAERHELNEQHGISEMMEARISSPVEMPGNGY